MPRTALPTTPLAVNRSRAGPPPRKGTVRGANLFPRAGRTNSPVPGDPCPHTSSHSPSVRSHKAGVANTFRLACNDTLASLIAHVAVAYGKCRRLETMKRTVTTLSTELARGNHVPKGEAAGRNRRRSKRGRGGGADLPTARSADVQARSFDSNTASG